jgi:hypothetical protein
MIELLTVMVLTGIMLGTVITFMMILWRQSSTLQADQVSLGSRMNAGDYLRDAINSATGLIDQNDIADSHTNVPDPGDPSNNYWKTIHAVPGSTASTSGTTPILYFTRPSMDKFKNIIMNGTQPYLDNVVIYLDGSNKQLLGRTIANPYAPGNAAVSTCPPSSATSSCPSDKIILDNVSQIDTKYFSRSGNTIDWTSHVQTDDSGNPVVPTVYDGPDFPAVEVVEVTLHQSQKASVNGAEDVKNQTVVRVALRN